MALEATSKPKKHAKFFSINFSISLLSDRGEKDRQNIVTDTQAVQLSAQELQLLGRCLNEALNTFHINGKTEMCFAIRGWPARAGNGTSKDTQGRNAEILRFSHKGHWWVYLKIKVQRVAGLHLTKFPDDKKLLEPLQLLKGIQPGFSLHKRV